MKLCFWCDSRINFKAHLNWISVGARKCSSHFFFLLVPSIQFGIMVSGPCCTRWSASFVVDIFFYFCKIYTQISLRVCWMFSVCIRFFFRRLIFRKTLWTVFFETFSSVIFCLFFFTQRFISKNGRSKGGESKMIYCIVSICLASMDQTFSPASITNNGFVWQIWSASNCTNLRLILCTEIPSQTDERTINLVSKSWCCWWYKEEMRENVIR